MAKELSNINPYLNVTAPTTNCIGIFNILKDDGKWDTYHKGFEINA